MKILEILYFRRMTVRKPAWFRGTACLIAVFATLLGQALGEPSTLAQKRGLLWKVSSGERSLYLLGSIHFLKQELYPLNPAILAAFDISKKIVLEIDLNSLSPESMQKVTLSKALLTDGSTLPQKISAETYDIVKARLRELGMDAAMLGPMKPWFVALTMMSLKLKQLGLDPNLGVDRHLANRAKASGKPTVGLETMEFQMSLLDELSPKEQELMLRETAREMELLEKNVHDIVASWSDGDAGRLEQLMLAGMKEFPEIHRKILIDRNRRWLPAIDKLLQENSGAMVVVGAAHLVGTEGLVDLLKKQGYQLEQM